MKRVVLENGQRGSHVIMKGWGLEHVAEKGPRCWYLERKKNNGAKKAFDARGKVNGLDRRKRKKKAWNHE